MKLWAVVIGKESEHLRYVAYVHHPDNLAVFDTRKKAREYIKYQHYSGPKYVHVVPFVEEN